ASIKWL
ncbi:hypothetical protein D018_4899B, partial [Vibrio parahaemolyticus VP2007-007]